MHSLPAKFLAPMAFILLCPAPAAARPPWLVGFEISPQGKQQARISVADIDLASAAGPQQLRARIEIVARMLCAGPLPDDALLTGVPHTTGCRRATVAAVEPQLEAVIARARNGVRVATLSVRSRDRRRG